MRIESHERVGRHRGIASWASTIVALWATLIGSLLADNTLTGSWSPSVPAEGPRPAFPDEWESRTNDGTDVVAHATQFPYGRVILEKGNHDAAVSQLLASDPDLVYDEESESFFKVIFSKKTWADALASAQNMVLDGSTGQLATIRSEAQNEFLAEMITAAGKDVFIGGADIGNDGVWRWHVDGVATDQFWQGDHNGEIVGTGFAAWKADEPKAGKDVIKFKKSGEWEADDPQHEHEYLVEWKDTKAGKIATGSHGFTNSAAKDHHSLSLKYTWDSSLTYQQNRATDDYSSSTFSGGTGWSGSWDENDTDPDSPTKGKIKIVSKKECPDSGVGGCMEFQHSSSVSITRGVDLSGSAKATLSYLYAHEKLGCVL